MGDYNKAMKLVSKEANKPIDELTDKAGALYPDEFEKVWPKCQETYDLKLYVINLGGMYDYKDIVKLRNICDKYKIDTSKYSDADLWFRYIIMD